MRAWRGRAGPCESPFDPAVMADLPEEVMFEHRPEWMELVETWGEESSRQRVQLVQRP